MKKSLILVLLVTICTIQKAYPQTQSFTIPLQKQYGLERGISFVLNQLYEVKDVSRFNIPKGINNFVIGYLDISPYHTLYNSRLINDENLLEYYSMVEENDWDTTQFSCISIKNTKLHVLIYMQKGIKNIILDTNFDNSFLDEQAYRYNFKRIKESVADEGEYIYADLKLPMDSLQHSTSKSIPIGILMNYIDPSDQIGNNDSLQVYISPNFFYKGYFIDDTDTVFINVSTKNFDLYYPTRKIWGTYYCKSCLITNPKEFVLGKHFQIKNHKYLFTDFNIADKTLIITRLEDDTIGVNRGNYFAKMSGLDSLSGYSLVFFTGSWCKPCKILLDSLFLFHKQHPETAIINVNHEVNRSEFENYLNKYKIPWKVVLDLTPKQWSSIYKDTYNVMGFPTLFLINPQRKILWVASDLYQGLELLNKIDKEGYEPLETFFK